MSIFASRRKKALSLAGGKDLVAATGANLFWLTGFWGSGAGVVHDDRTVIVTSILEEDRANELGKEVEVIAVGRWAEVPTTLVKQLHRKVALVDDDRELRATGRFTAKPDLFLEARRVKEETEVERIRKASRGLDRIFEELPSLLKPGATEWEVAAEVMRLATLNELTPSGSDSSLSPTIIASGENGALPHSELTRRKMREGDFVVADIFFRYDGYNSDATRTFAVGSATPEMKKHYRVVQEAQEAALALIRPGTPCMDVHNGAVEVLRKHRLEKYLNHSIGHGVGIDIHELPPINRVNKGRLLENDVVTDEPGIYFKGKYGIRIEDTVKTARKSEVLTRFTKDLVVTG